MKFLKNIPKSLAALGIVLTVSSCNLFDLDINQDPNNPSAVNPELLLASAEINMAYSMNNFSDVSMGFNGLIASWDNWTLSQGSFNFSWASLYTSTLKDVQGLIEATEAIEGEREESSNYLGVAKIMKGYIGATMVDYWGDIPFSEALKGEASENRNPKFDSGADVYQACLTLLDEGIELLGKGNPIKVKGDAIYGGDVKKWQKFARSVKLKMYMNLRLKQAEYQDEIEELVANPADLISSASEDFQLKAGFAETPDYRHPWFSSTYGGGSNGFTYILHQPMVEMLIEKDPRWPFYFRRQTDYILDQTNSTERNSTPCSNYTNCEYGYVVLNDELVAQIYPDGNPDLAFLAGIFGRDAGDPSGTPQDEGYRTIPGVYPCGGNYDVAAPAPSQDGAPGGGIVPMLTHVNVQYLMIEAMMRYDVAGDARATFENVINSHISKVVSFGTSTDDNAVAPDATVVSDYVAAQMAKFDAAPNEDAQFNIVMRQLWYASWGSAIELYNAKRRTGYPTGIQQPLESNDRTYPLRLPYPQTELSLNSNASQYAGIVYDQDYIFWDN